MDLIGWIVVGIVVLVILYVVGTYNRLVSLRNRIEEAWAQIDVQLRRRHDLIPNLVETVKGYAAHERETLEAVIQARGQAVAATGVENQAQAENFLTQALGRLFAVAEQYPNLKANENFMALQEELTSTEGRIAVARQLYNERALSYDNALESFPSNVIAGAFNFEPQPYFEAEQTAREPVRVDFGSGTAPREEAPPASEPQRPPTGPVP